MVMETTSSVLHRTKFCSRCTPGQSTTCGYIYWSGLSRDTEQQGVYICMCVWVYTYIYIYTHTYIERERERESERFIIRDWLT